MKPESKNTQHTQLDEFQLPGAEMQVANPDSSQGLLPNGEVDQEGAMAKADLFKLSNYSFKLFKKIQDDDQLESWVQAKITKAADYIASVYHYLEYEMKISEYGAKLENSDMYSESQKEIIKNKLNEAREMVRFLKIAQAKKLSESKSLKYGSAEEYYQEHIVESKKYMQLDEISKETLKPYIKAASQDLVDKSTKLAKTDSSKKQAELGRKVVNRTHGIASATDRLEEKQLDELSKDTLKSYTKRASRDIDNKAYKLGKISTQDDTTSQQFGDLDNKIRQRKKGIEKAVDKMEESKPSAGLSKAKKSTVVKDAKAGKDIGKPGKNFDAVAKKAGGGEKGKKIAAAAMWKNIKENVELNEGIFSDTSPEEIAKTNSTMAELLAFRNQYQGTSWSQQIEDRIKQLAVEINNDHIPQGPDGNPMKALPPEEWAKKNPHGIHESTEMAFGEGVYAEDQQIDELNLKPWEKKSPFSKEGYKKVADRQKTKMKDAETATDTADEDDDEEGINQAGRDWKKAKSFKDKAERKATLAKNESLNESAELVRMKEFLTRLNG